MLALLNSEMERYEDQWRHKTRSCSIVMLGGVRIKEDTYLGPTKHCRRGVRIKGDTNLGSVQQ